MRSWMLAGAMLALAHGASAQAPNLTYSQPLSPAAVGQVQERLRQAGLYAGRADGIWGPDSQQALERFQQSRGLQVTGQLNQATAATMGLGANDLLSTGANAAPAPAASADPLSPAAVRNVQGRLRTLGFYRGAVDGTWGPGTQQALERFQQGRGLQVTGQINPATAASLGLDANNLATPIR